VVGIEKPNDHAETTIVEC